MTLILPTAVFLLIATIGAVISYFWESPEPVASGKMDSPALPGSRMDGELLARFKDYARSTEAEEPASVADAEVNTTIRRRAARLEIMPEDFDGWRMLGWSHFHAGRYEQAAAAFARAVELRPGSADRKLSYEAVKSKASGDGNPGRASILEVEARRNGVGQRGAGRFNGREAMLSCERDAAIRSMVDQLTHRLEKSPRDIGGWTSLMRSQVVLGERELAVAAFRKALEVFEDDPAASGKTAAVAIELGLSNERSFSELRSVDTDA